MLNPERKIISREQACEIASKLKAEHQVLVFTNGCFDILHAGHIFLLSKARALGDTLMVGLNSDASIKRIKGPDRPVQNEKTRSMILASLEMVDWVVLFDEDTPANLIECIKPLILVKGGDYKREEIVGHEVVEAAGGKVVIIPLLEGFSTTDILRKLDQKDQS